MDEHEFFEEKRPEEEKNEEKSFYGSENGGENETSGYSEKGFCAEGALARVGRRPRARRAARLRCVLFGRLMPRI